jgi:ubiquitin C-terminal hydrolase
MTRSSCFSPSPSPSSSPSYQNKSSSQSPSNSQIPFLYHLFALVVHHGNAGFGHYIAFCLHPVLNKWYCYNDEMIEEVREEVVLKQQVYIF